LPFDFVISILKPTFVSIFLNCLILTQNLLHYPFIMGKKEVKKAKPFLKWAGGKTTKVLSKKENKSK
jgi:hypothetical protein